MRTITANWILLSIYAVATAGVLVAALILPGFRSLAYRPLARIALAAAGTDRPFRVVFHRERSLAE